MEKEALLSKLTNYINEIETEKIIQKDLISYINKIWDDGKEKVKKGPSEYNLFIKDQMAIIKINDPTMKDKMKYIAKLWNDKKKLNIKGKTPRKAL